MLDQQLKLLLLEDNLDHQQLIRRHLQRVSLAHVDLDCVGCLRDGAQQAKEKAYDCLLVDLNLPDSRREETLAALADLGQDMPVVALTSLDDMELATRAVQQGAQDYLIKSEVNGELLVRSIRYAIERKKIDRERRRYALELEQRNAELKRFAHTVAHEVRNPLQVMTYFLALVQPSQDKLDPSVREMLGSAQQAAQGMGELVNDLLEFASVGARQLQTEPVSLAALLAAVADELRAARVGEFQIAHGELPTIYADPTQMRHLLQNLVGNAVKYRGSETPRIEIRVEQRPDPHAKIPAREVWRFAIVDNGRGIPPADCERVFDAFYRAHLDDDATPGTGLGLPFCRRIVENHGGRIWVESAVGAGSVFRFTLPADPQRVEEPEDDVSTRRRDAPAAEREDRQRVSRG